MTITIPTLTTLYPLRRWLEALDSREILLLGFVAPDGGAVGNVSWLALGEFAGSIPGTVTFH